MTQYTTNLKLSLEERNLFKNHLLLLSETSLDDDQEKPLSRSFVNLFNILETTPLDEDISLCDTFLIYLEESITHKIQVIKLIYPRKPLPSYVSKLHFKILKEKDDSYNRNRDYYDGDGIPKNIKYVYCDLPKDDENKL